MTLLVASLTMAADCVVCASVAPMIDLYRVVQSRFLKKAWLTLLSVVGIIVLLVVLFSVEKIGDSYNVEDFFVSAIFLLGSFLILSIVWLARRTGYAMLRLDKLEEAAFVDPLTGLANRRRFDERLSHEVRRCRQFGLPLSIAIVDIDHFKSVNDKHGHAVGDRVLQQVGAVISANIRHVDVACRIGGEEFTIIISGIDTAAAIAGAERLRHAVTDTPFLLDGGGQLRVTISVGVATLLSDESIHALYERADAALYVAKNSGRNLVRSAA